MLMALVASCRPRGGEGRVNLMEAFLIGDFLAGGAFLAFVREGVSYGRSA